MEQKQKVDYLALARIRAAEIAAAKAKRESELNSGAGGPCEAGQTIMETLKKPAAFIPPEPSTPFVPQFPEQSGVFLKLPTALDSTRSGAQNAKAEIDFTDEQKEAIRLALSGQSFCLIGAAGTGKTTTVRAIIAALLEHNKIGRLQQSTKHYQENSLAIACVSFTNRAVQNVKRQMPKELHGNCHTIHKTLEYAPVWYTIIDETGKERTTMRFEPSRDRENPLPDLEVIIHDESSMIGLELHSNLVKATPGAVRIYLGDLNQLPPIYDSAILGFKLLSLPVIELTKIWRQGKDSAIITLAHAIKDGERVGNKRLKELASMTDEIELRPYSKKRNKDDAMLAMSRHIDMQLAKEFNPYEDIMLCPQNKGFGSIEINACFAQYYSEKAKQPVWQVISGKFKKYFAVGDKVMFEKVDYVIESIQWNPEYVGTTPIPPSLDLNRYGQHLGKHTHLDVDMMDSLADAEESWSVAHAVHLDKEIEDKVNQASHIIKLRPIEDIGKMPSECYFTELSTAGEISSLEFSYCISVHKSQGSEYNKVYVVLHNSHGNMLQRELLYTAVTRARKKLVMYYDPDSSDLAQDGCISKAIKNITIPGKTWRDKAEKFKGKIERIQDGIELG